MHLGHKIQAEATVVAAELIERDIYRDKNVGVYGRPRYDRWGFVLDVQPSEGPAFRVKVEQEFWDGNTMPQPGQTVNVRYGKKHPDEVELALDKDPRYDGLMKHDEREQAEQAEQAQRRAYLDEAMQGAPGSAPAPPPEPYVRPGSIEESARSFTEEAHSFLVSALVNEATRERATNGGQAPVTALARLDESYRDGDFEEAEYKALRSRLLNGEV